MLKKLQKIGIKLNYLLKATLFDAIFIYFQSKIELERRKNSEIQKIMF